MFRDIVDAFLVKNWVFIAGMNNSGTTMIDRYMGQHPEINSMSIEGKTSFFMSWRTWKERLFWNRYIKIPKLGRPKTKLTRIFTDDVDRSRYPPLLPVLGFFLLKYDWMKHRLSRNGKYMLEKSPPNTVRIPWLLERFPSSRFIIIIRNGYAVTEGINRRAPIVPDRDFSVENGSRHWNKANKIMYQDLDELVEAGKMSKDDYIVIRYEDFCGDPLRELRRVESMLGLEPAEYVDLEKINDRNEIQIARLTREDLNTISSEASEMLEKLGYNIL